ncbi:MAG TPA: discoidin domain-containing protein [Verrucomicrobiae bacterium]|nr:discoidin domain-containing protein [Verrucomicrobiae bacterium]
MNGAINAYNTYANYSGSVPVNYNSGVPTAQASYQGWVTFGGSRSFRVALHEMGHWMGAGTYNTWNNLRDGKWIGTYGNAAIQAFDGPGDRIGADASHFWPYGWNFDNEAINPERHVALIGAMRRDMGLSDSTIGMVPGTYRLRNRATVKMLDNGGNNAEGAPLVQMDNSAATSQRWTITLLAGGYFTLQNVASGRNLDTLGVSTNGAPIVLSAPGTNFSQQWQVVASDSGFYRIANRATGKYLDAANQQASGAAIQSWGSDLSGDQEWKFVSTSVVNLPAPGAISQGQPATASSTESGNDQWEGNDGAPATRWAASSGSFPQWWRVDLGSVQPITKVVIDWYNASPRAYRYRIEVSSDDVNYTVVADKTGNNVQGTTTDLVSATGRYVRVTITGATAGWAGLWEVRVFNDTAPLELASQYRPATASSSLTGNLPVNSNDGDPAFTRWTASSTAYPQWWRVDLGTVQLISKAVVQWLGAGSRAYKYRIETSTDDATWTVLLDKTGNTATGTTTDQFSAYARYVRVTATGVAPAGSAAAFYECQIYSRSLSPWTSADIGDLQAPGSSSISNGVFSVAGSGSDIGGTSDEFHFVYQPVAGDFIISARVTASDNTNPWAKAGLMIRESTNANSRYVLQFITPENGIALDARPGTGDETEHLASEALVSIPYWLRLARSGNTVTAYRSANGVNWLMLGSTAVASSGNSLVGLAVSSRNDGVVNTSMFDKVAITLPLVPGNVAGLIATGGNRSIGLQWTSAMNAASYTVKRSPMSGGPYATVSSGVTGNVYVDSSLTNGVTYYYRVSASNADGESVDSPEASATANVAPAQLHAWLKFDEAAGMIAADSAGNGWNGTLVNSPVRAAGYAGNAVNLASANSQHVTLPAGILTNLFDFSISAWVRLNSLSSWTRLFDFGTGTSVNMFLTPQNGANNAVRFAITTSGGGGEQVINGAGPLPVGVWKHVAVTVSGSEGILYIDGIPVGTNSSLSLKPAHLGSTTLNYLGRSQYSDPYLNGLIDDFRIYRGTLTPGEVATFLTPLAAPAALTAAGGYGWIELQWEAVASATGYNVFRSESEGGPYEWIGSTTFNAFTNGGLGQGLPYFYVVNSTNAAGESPLSAAAGVVTAIAAPPAITANRSAGNLQLEWPAGNFGWRLEMQTNSANAGIGTNWISVELSTSTNRMVLPVSPEPGNVFFRLVYP